LTYFETKVHTSKPDDSPGGNKNHDKIADEQPVLKSEWQEGADPEEAYGGDGPGNGRRQGVQGDLEGARSQFEDVQLAHHGCNGKGGVVVNRIGDQQDGHTASL